MNQAALSKALVTDIPVKLSYTRYLLIFCAGLLGPLGFAPFHMPGLTLISLSLLYAEFIKATPKQGFLLGFIYGMANFGLGVSWVIASIHDYGHINYFLSGLITLLFLIYLSLFPALVGFIFKKIPLQRPVASMLLFSCLWCAFEYLRAHFMTGFPWLMIGTPLIDTPLKYLAPVIGVYGLGLLCALSATLLYWVLKTQTAKRYYYLITLVCILITPGLLSHIQWTKIKSKAVSIGAVQANLSMRDKWDESLFWKLLTYYEKATNSLLGKQLIILPESAIPLPASYLPEYLHRLHEKALKAKSALIVGILQAADDEQTNYYNQIMTLGLAQGLYNKRQLVPFGEYIPQPFVAINRWLDLPEANIVPGERAQKLITIVNHPIASLICYEIAYPSLLRMQMPKSQWIVSISDNGWFGRSLASYQQQQMAQMLSLLTGRYQILVNNDGLSSVINDRGDLVQALPSFSSGILQSEIYPATGITPWILVGEHPALIFCATYLFLILVFHIRRVLKQ